MSEVKEINYKKIIIFLMIIGIVMRAIFMLVTKVYYFQYDFGIKELNGSKDYDSLYLIEAKDTELYEEGLGFDYVRTIYKTGHLPTTSISQFYHPPLNFALLAFWLKIMDIFPLSSEVKIESMQLLPFIYSIISMYFLKKILDEMDISDKAQMFTIAFYVFTPLLIFMSEMLNGDMLVTTFALAALYFLIKWEKKPNIKDTIMLGLMIGVGTNAKTSMAVIGIITAIIFIKKFFKLLFDIEKNKDVLIQIIIDTIVLCIIAFPLMFWYQVRNSILFEQPMFSVIPADEKFYCDNQSNFYRFNVFSKELFTNSMGEKDSNVFAYLIKSIIIFGGELDVEAVTVAKFLMIIFFFFSIYTGLYMLYKNTKEDGMIRRNTFLNFVVILAWTLSFIGFNVSLPYSVTMHGRFLMIMFLFLAIQISCFIDYKNSINEGDSKIVKLINIWSMFYYVMVISINIMIVIGTMRL